MIIPYRLPFINIFNQNYHLKDNQLISIIVTTNLKIIYIFLIQEQYLSYIINTLIKINLKLK